MSKKVITKTSKKPKKTVSVKRGIDKIKLVVGDESRPFVQSNQPAMTQMNQEWDGRELGSIQPWEHDLTPTKTDLTVMFICGALSMASMGIVIWLVMKLLS